MNDDRDPIIDACLEELLGGQRPPDVSNRVLREWAQRQAGRAPEISLGTDSVLPPACGSASVAMVSSAAAVNRHVSRLNQPVPNGARARRAWRGIAFASAALAVGPGLLFPPLNILLIPLV